LEKVVSEKPTAVKIHGIAAGIMPEQVPKEVFKIIAQSGRPIILHTDNFNGSLETPFNYLRRVNNAMGWISALSRNGVRGYISHGGYLCPKSFEIINASDQFLLGLGPVKLIEADKVNLLQFEDENYSDYLSKIFNKVNLDKVSFDIDFPCNVSDFSYTQEDLVSKDFVASHLNFTEQKKVFIENAERFFED
jgi:hypothetical protein